jgi:hypothetical protein
MFDSETAMPPSIIGIPTRQATTRSEACRFGATSGRRPNIWSVASIAKEVRTQIGLAGQSASVDSNLTGRENLRLIGRLVRLPRGEVASARTTPFCRSSWLDRRTRAAPLTLKQHG